MPDIHLIALTTLRRERRRRLTVTRQAGAIPLPVIHTVRRATTVPVLLLILLIRLPELYPVQVPSRPHLANVLPAFTGCLIRAVGVCLMDQLMYPLEVNHIVLTQPAVQPATPRHLGDTTVAVSLMTRSLKNAETALVREDLTGTVVNA